MRLKKDEGSWLEVLASPLPPQARTGFVTKLTVHHIRSIMMSESKLGYLLLGLIAASMLAVAAPIQGREAGIEAHSLEQNVYSDIRRGRRAVGDMVGSSLVEREVLKRIVMVGGHEGEIGGKARAGPFIIQPLGDDDLPPPPPPENPTHVAKLKLEPATHSGGIRLHRVGLVIPDSQPLPAVKSTPVGLVGLAAGTGLYSGKIVFDSETLDDTISGLRLHIGTVNRPQAIHPDSPQVGGDEKKDPRSVGDEKAKDVKAKKNTAV